MRSNRCGLPSVVLALAWATPLLVACHPRNQLSFARLKEGRATADGAIIHYRIGGSGPPLLLLHGFMGSAAAWDRFAPALGDRYTLIIPDMPGHGYSTGLPDVWSYRRVASQMFELLDHLDVQPVRAIGCSAGAVTLIHMALQQPERLEAMVLVSGSHRLTDKVRQGLRNLPPLEQLTEWHDWNRKNNPRGDSQSRALLALLRGIGDNFDDFNTPLDRLALIPTRTLIATGDRDENPPLEVEFELHRTLPNSELWVLPNAGHCPFWGDLPGGSPQAEKLFAAVVLGFLEVRAGDSSGLMHPRKP